MVVVVAYLFAYILPLHVQFVQFFLDVDGKGWLCFFLKVQTHFVDSVHAGLDGVDVIHQSLVKVEGAKNRNLRIETV